MPEIHLHGFGERSVDMQKRIAGIVFAISHDMALETVTVIHGTIVQDCHNGRHQPFVEVRGTKDDDEKIKAIVESIRDSQTDFDLIIGPEIQKFIPFPLYMGMVRIGERA